MQTHLGMSIMVSLKLGVVMVVQRMAHTDASKQCMVLDVRVLWASKGSSVGAIRQKAVRLQ